MSPTCTTLNCLLFVPCSHVRNEVQRQIQGIVKQQMYIYGFVYPLEEMELTEFLNDVTIMIKLKENLAG